MNEKIIVNKSKLFRLILENGNAVGASVFLLLAWIAASDGDIDDSEAQAIAEMAAASKYEGSVAPLLALVQKRDVASLHLAAEVVKSHAGIQGNPELFLMMAIRVAVADRFLLSGENHILRFFADLLGLSSNQLNAVFMEATGKEFPDALDLSDADYWHARSRSSRRADENSDAHSGRRRSRPEHDAYAELGLNPGATKEEIKQAYRRLAQANHPDRFTALGKEAVAVATNNFQRIKSAYDYLMNHA